MRVRERLEQVKSPLRDAVVVGPREGRQERRVAYVAQTTSTACVSPNSPRRSSRRSAIQARRSSFFMVGSSAARRVTPSSRSIDFYEQKRAREFQTLGCTGRE